MIVPSFSALSIGFVELSFEGVVKGKGDEFPVERFVLGFPFFNCVLELVILLLVPFGLSGKELRAEVDDLMFEFEDGFLLEDGTEVFVIFLRLNKI